jgi:hypothetical protein
VLREQEGVRGYAELQSKHRAAYGDDEEAREAAGRAALLRAKESLSTGWAEKINIENNGRSPDTMEKLGSIPRTPTLRVLAAQQDLAFCFVLVLSMLSVGDLMLCFFFGICCGRTGERDGSASASGCTGGDAGVWRVYLCALLLVLNHAILNKARAEEGAHPLGGLS